MLSLLVTLAFLAGSLAAPASAQKAAAFREVSFQTSDGARIHANLYGDGDHAVVLAHGAAFDKESWDSLAKELSAGGVRVLAIDFRGYGNSTEGRERGALYLDVLGAMQYLKAAGANRVSLLGGSMGGGAVAEAATRVKPGEIDRLILLAALPVADPGRLQGNKLFIVSEGDGLVTTVREQFKQARELKKLTVLRGDAHAQNIFRTPQSTALTSIITQWLYKETP